MKTPKDLTKSKLFKSSLAFITASTIILSPAIYAVADEYDRVELHTQNNEDTNAASEEQTTQLTNEKQTENSAEKDTDLKETLKTVPGDFFYFAKVFFEKIKLLPTFDEVKEAKLLANFASERIAEAESLLHDGKEDQAIEVIEKAIQNLQDAEKAVTDEKTDKEVTKEENSKVVEETTTEATNPKVENEETDKKEEDQNSVNDDLQDKEKEIKQLVSNNIIALTKAMEKVKNPTAKAALQKNIEKAYAKLAKKAEKIVDEEASMEEAKTPEKEETKKDSELDKVSLNIKENGTSENKTNETIQKDHSDQQIDPVPSSTKQIQKEQKAEIKMKDKEIKEEVKKEKNELKAKEKQVKEEAKKAQKEIKAKEKQLKEQMKQERKELKHAHKEWKKTEKQQDQNNKKKDKQNHQGNQDN